MLDELAASLAALTDVEIERHVPAGPYCTYRVGGPFSILATVQSTAGLVGLAEAFDGADIPTLVIGRGSNLLVADDGFDGVAIHLAGNFADFEIDEAVVTAGSAVALPVLARATVAAGLTGFEWAVGVPGSVGGAVRMNAGGHGSDMAATLQSVTVLDLRLGGLLTVPAPSLGLGYRDSSIEPWQIVATAKLDLQPGPVEDGEALLREVVAWRRAHQPGGANAGSVFTNPPDDSAGRLIDSAGLKRSRYGSAEVSDKHANFIQVDAEGSADDIVALMRQIVDRVHRESGVRLSAETRLMGFDAEVIAEIQPPDGAVSDDVAGGA